MEELIRELAAASRYERSAREDRTELIRSPEGEEFIVRRVEDPQDTAMEKVHACMVREFGEDESDTIRWLRYTLQEGISDYYVIESKIGEVVAFSNTQYLELQPSEGKEHLPKESIVAVWHILTDRESRNKGLASELYQSFYIRAFTEARSHNHVLKGIIGEALSGVESFLNRMGRKRMYFEDQAGNVHEVPYMCPPVAMDLETGEPLAPPMPEHVMLRLTNGDQELSVDELLRMVEAMYREYTEVPENYDCQGAFERARQYNEELQNQMRRALAHTQGQKVFLMSASERKQKRQELHAQGKDLREIE